MNRKITLWTSTAAACLALAGCSTAAVTTSTHTQQAQPAAKVASPSPPPSLAVPGEPVSTQVCQNVKASLAAYAGASGISFPSLGSEGEVGNAIWTQAQTIPGSEVYYQTSQTPDLKVSLDIFSQQLITASHGGAQPPGSSDSGSEMPDIQSDCQILGVTGIFGAGS